MLGVYVGAEAEAHAGSAGEGADAQGRKKATLTPIWDTLGQIYHHPPPKEEGRTRNAPARSAGEGERAREEDRRDDH